MRILQKIMHLCLETDNCGQHLHCKMIFPSIKLLCLKLFVFILTFIYSKFSRKYLYWHETNIWTRLNFPQCLVSSSLFFLSEFIFFLNIFLDSSMTEKQWICKIFFSKLFQIIPWHWKKNIEKTNSIKNKKTYINSLIPAFTHKLSKISF